MELMPGNKILLSEAESMLLARKNHKRYKQAEKNWKSYGTRANPSIWTTIIAEKNKSRMNDLQQWENIYELLYKRKRLPK